VEDEEEEDLVFETNHFFTTGGLPIFLTEDEEYAESFDILKDENYILANDVVLEAKCNDYHRGYMNSLSA